MKLHKAEKSQPEAITEMIAILADDDYEIRIRHGGVKVSDDNELYPIYQIEVTDTDGTAIARGSGYYLIDALSDAYQSTPERGK